MAFMESLEPYVTHFLNDQELDVQRKTWSSRVARRQIYFYRGNWWVKYKIRRFRRPVFYIVIGNYLDDPIQIDGAARFDHMLLGREDCPHLPPELQQYFEDNGEIVQPDPTFPQNEVNMATDIGSVQINLPQSLLSNTREGRNQMNIEANVDALFAYRVICQMFVHNEPILQFLRENNI
jgi:hypothetical protein